MKSDRLLVVGCKYSASADVFPLSDALRVLVTPPALVVVAAADGAGAGSASATSTAASGGILPVTWVCLVTAIAGVFTTFVTVNLSKTASTTYIVLQLLRLFTAFHSFA